MTRVLDALRWDGITPVVSMFVVSPSQVTADLAGMWHVDELQSLETYRLEDDRQGTNSTPVHEYDFQLATLPADLQQRLENCLRAACEIPGSVAWLAFEGSFHFDHLLTEDVAGQIYGVCASGESPVVVLDDEPASRRVLGEQLAVYRGRLALTSAPGRPAVERRRPPKPADPPSAHR